MDIVKLEVKNLSTEEKEELYEVLKLDQEFKNFNNNDLDKVWIDYLRAFPDHFINFRKNTKTSLYNQTIKKYDFKNLSYEDVVQNLTLKQKDKVVHDIISLVQNLKDEDGYSYDVEPYIMKMTNRVWEYFKKIEINKESNEVWEQRKKSKYVLVLPNNNNKKGGVGFFKNDEELILFALSKKELAHEILYLHEKYLNPHYKVNQRIVTNQKLEST